MRAKAAWKAVKDAADVLQFGAFAEREVTLDGLDSQMGILNDQLKALEKKRDWEKEEASKAFKSLHLLIQGVVFKDEAWKTQVEVEKTQNNLESIQAQYDEIASKLISQVREEQKQRKKNLLNFVPNSKIF